MTDSKQAAAAAIVLMLGAASAITLASNPAQPAADIHSYDVRFSGISEVLGAVREAGYISDLGSSGPGTAPFYATQYALAPVVLIPGASRELVVGNFTRPDAITDAATKFRLTIVKDLNNGAVVFRKGAR
ncbi:MAG TPA: hypothetical protein VF767_03095 [Bryobacteraceae bacterium]